MPAVECLLTGLPPGSLPGQQVFQIGKGLRSGAIRRRFAALASGLNRCIVFQFARVLVVVAIQTEQFPVAAIGRIVVVVVVAVMHGELLQVLARELARATPTNPRVDLQRLFTVTQLARLAVAQRLGNHSVSVCTLYVINSQALLLVGGQQICADCTSAATAWDNGKFVADLPLERRFQGA